MCFSFLCAAFVRDRTRGERGSGEAHVSKRKRSAGHLRGKDARGFGARTW